MQPLTHSMLVAVASQPAVQGEEPRATSSALDVWGWVAAGSTRPHLQLQLINQQAAISTHIDAGRHHPEHL
jgi:hypothetical protein